jgi:hypothetical protein
LKKATGLYVLSQEFVKVYICSRNIFFGQLTLHSLFYNFLRQERILLSILTEAGTYVRFAGTRIAFANYLWLHMKVCSGEYVLMLAAQKCILWSWVVYTSLGKTPGVRILKYKGKTKF